MTEPSIARRSVYGLIGKDIGQKRREQGFYGADLFSVARDLRINIGSSLGGLSTESRHSVWGSLSEGKQDND